MILLLFSDRTVLLQITYKGQHRNDFLIEFVIIWNAVPGTV